jgi:hypothetical protein
MPPKKMQKLKAPKKTKPLKLNPKTHRNKVLNMNPFLRQQEKEMDTIIENYNIRRDSDYESESETETSSSSDDDFNPIISMGNRKKVIAKKEEEIKFNGLNIGYIPTNKDEIELRPLAKAGITPRPYSAFHIICGRSGMGKSNLLISMLLNPLIFGFDGSGKHWFDNLYVLTNSNDDIYFNLIKEGVLKDEHIKHMPDEKHLKEIIDKQKEAIEIAGDDASKKPVTCIILDDIIDNKQFMNSKYVKLLAVRARQLGIVSFVLSQYFNAIPKLMRMQSSSLLLFAGNQQEQELYNEMLCPAGVNKKEFDKVMTYCWEKTDKDKFPFMHVNMKNTMDKRFMKNFTEFINIDNFKNNI